MTMDKIKTNLPTPDANRTLLERHKAGDLPDYSDPAANVDDLERDEPEPESSPHDDPNGSEWEGDEWAGVLEEDIPDDPDDDVRRAPPAAETEPARAAEPGQALFEFAGEAVGYDLFDGYGYEDAWKKGALVYHEHAKLADPMTPEEERELRNSLLQRGWDAGLGGIVMFEGEVLDGRHRERIARELWTELQDVRLVPTFSDFEGTDLAALHYVRARLILRAQTPAQKAFSASRFIRSRERIQGAAAAETGRSSAAREAANVTGAKPRSIERARYIEEEGPDALGAEPAAQLIDDVKRGKATLKGAEAKIRGVKKQKAADEIEAKAEARPDHFVDVGEGFAPEVRAAILETVNGPKPDQGKGKSKKPGKWAPPPPKWKEELLPWPRTASLVKQSTAVVHCHCLELAERLPSASVSTAFLDMPYLLPSGKGDTTNKGGKRVPTTPGKWDQQPIDDFVGLLDDLEQQLARVVAVGGVVWITATRHILFVAASTFGEGSDSFNVKWELLQDIVWQKPNPPPRLDPDSGWTDDHEHLLLFLRVENKSLPDSRKKARKLAAARGEAFDTKAAKAIVGDRATWTIGPPAAAETEYGKHPTQKPAKLLAAILNCNKGLVFDPFGGSSTTAVEAIKLGRPVITAELEPEYLAIGRARVLAELGDDRQGTLFSKATPASSRSSSMWPAGQPGKATRKASKSTKVTSKARGMIKAKPPASKPGKATSKAKPPASKPGKVTSKAKAKVTSKAKPAGKAKR